MIILHLDMDAFFAAVEERDNPQFRGLPIVIGADPRAGSGRGVVSTANYEARKYGIKSAMPVSWAWKTCPHAAFLPVDMKRYAKVSRSVMGIVRKYAQKMEQVSIDEAYLELRVTSYESAKKIAKKIKKKIWEKERLTCSIGIGPNKLVAKIASDHQKPEGLIIVRPAEVQKFLDPQLVDVIPGVGPKTKAILNKLGVHLIKELRSYSKNKLIETLGVNGAYIWEMANGQDTRTVVEEREVKSVGRQTTFLRDVRESGPIVDAVIELLEEVFQELQEKGLQGRTLTVTVRYSGFETYTSQKSMTEPLTLDRAKKLALKLLLPYFNGKGIRLVGVRVSNWVQK